MVETAQTELHTFKFNEHELELHTIPGRTFQPNQVTGLIYNAIKIHDDETGIEIGAGIGPLTILTASKPIEHLYTTEIVQKQCEVAGKNIKKHGLEHKVTILQGNLFQPIRDQYPDLKADFIVSDVSGMTDVGYELEWYPNNIPTGGLDGTENILPLLEQAPSFLNTENPKARIYFPIIPQFSDSEKILDTARSHFGKLEKIAFQKIPLKQEQMEIIKNSKTMLYSPLEPKGRRAFWYAQVYKARNPLS